jgi:GT2 family glycosyltransferase
VRQALPAVREQLRADDELIVVDNDSADGTADEVRAIAPQANLIEPGSNLGFAAGSNRGAREASADLLLFLNPDATPADGFREAIEQPLHDGRSWAAWQGLVTAERGRVVNTRGGLVHFSGISWAGGAGEGLPTGQTVGEPGFVSGACLAIPRERYERLGGFAEDFFLYHEDVDLSLRLRLAGGFLGVALDARVDHEYEFEKGAGKWRRLERNRWATLIRTYPAALLAVLAPALAATELAMAPISIAGGWFGQKTASWVDLARSAPTLWRERREIQAMRAIGAREFSRALTPDLNSPYLGPVARSGLLRWALRAYWLVALALLGGSLRR